MGFFGKNSLIMDIHAFFVNQTDIISISKKFTWNQMTQNKTFTHFNCNKMFKFSQSIIFILQSIFIVHENLVRVCHKNLVSKCVYIYIYAFMRMIYI